MKKFIGHRMKNKKHGRQNASSGNPYLALAFLEARFLARMITLAQAHAFLGTFRRFVSAIVRMTETRTSMTARQLKIAI
jgi:hypothetical protein